jgi:hypothetical protein
MMGKRSKRWRVAVGWEFYEGKPMLGFFRDFYDCPIYSFHLGPLWVSYRP